jgi:hypothetical protein
MAKKQEDGPETKNNGGESALSQVEREETLEKTGPESGIGLDESCLSG